jgi:hypothetical protein
MKKGKLGNKTRTAYERICERKGEREKRTSGEKLQSANKPTNQEEL